MVLSDNNNKKELIKFAGLILGGLAAYKVLFSKKKTTIVDIPFKIVKVISKHSKELVKEVIEPVDKVVKKVDKVTKKAIKKVNKKTKKAIKKVDKKTKNTSSDTKIYKKWLKTATDSDKKSLKNTSKIYKLTLEEAYFTTFHKTKKAETIVDEDGEPELTINARNKILNKNINDKIVYVSKNKFKIFDKKPSYGKISTKNKRTTTFTFTTDNDKGLRGIYPNKGYSVNYEKEDEK